MKYKVYVDWLTQWGKDYLSHLKQIFQGKLTAGEGVTIDENNVISASSTGDSECDSLRSEVEALTKKVSDLSNLVDWTFILENEVNVSASDFAVGESIKSNVYQGLWSSSYDSFYPNGMAVVIELYKLTNAMGKDNLNGSYKYLIGRVGETLEVKGDYDINNPATITIALNNNGFVVTNTGTQDIKYLEANVYRLRLGLRHLKLY